MDQKKPEVIYSFAETYFANLYSVDWVADVYFSCQILKCTQLIKGSLTFFKYSPTTHLPTLDATTDQASVFRHLFHSKSELKAFDRSI